MKHGAVWLALALLLLCSVLIGYRILRLGYPLFPTAPGKAWQLSMEAYMRPDGNEWVTILIGLPGSHANQIVIEERITPDSLTFNLLREGPNQIGVWSGEAVRGDKVIAYRAMILVDPSRPSKPSAPLLSSYPPGVEKSDQKLAERMATRWGDLEPPARLRAILETTRGKWGEPPPKEEDIRAWATLGEKHGPTAALLTLFQAADLPARVLQGLEMAESVTKTLTTWIEVWTGREWEKIDPESGALYGKQVLFLPLTTGIAAAVRPLYGELSEIRWVLNLQPISRWQHHFERIVRSGRFLDRWSLFRLPSAFQETFRILILVPIGALMICVLRNLVGFPTFGIFMPVLMALAFRSTGIVYGLGLFAGVVLIGYGVRRWIDKLRLLLVPRLSVILTFVIFCFTLLALIGSKLDIREFMAIGLLPFVILTMTIERFYVIVEEAGPRKGLQTAAGSAAVALITHEVLHLDFLQLTFFVYPELLFAVAAVQILLGRYTGYRLSELLRFGVMGKRS